MPVISTNEMTELDKKMLRRTIEIAHQAMENGCHPFGALLCDKDGNILIEKGNNTTGSPCLHAETAVMIEAGEKYSPEFLETCAFYTNFEPCVMCTGAIYWTNVRKLVYGLTEKQLLHLTGSHEENPTFNLECREVLTHGQKDMVVIGPTEDPALIEAIIKDHRAFWK